jgi:hypothetical protein
MSPPGDSKSYIHGNGQAQVPVTVTLNSAGWEATGVINDLNLPMNGLRDGRFDASGQGGRRIGDGEERRRRWPNKAEIALRKKNLEERDRARAAELALREVLDSIKVAR